MNYLLELIILLQAVNTFILLNNLEWYLFSVTFHMNKFLTAPHVHLNLWYIKGTIKKMTTISVNKKIN